jgi:predicted amidohydrolase
MKNLVALQLKTGTNFEKNLSKLVKHIEKQENDSIILAPELFLTGYSYDNLERAASFTKKALKVLKYLSLNKTLSLTLMTQKNGKFYNTLYVFHYGNIIHTQSKNKLFTLNNEQKYFSQGDEKDIKIFKIGQLKIAALICFELRYTELWQQIKGCDIVFVPAMWGKLRKQNYETLTQALAVVNQCYVIASDSSNSEMAKSSAIITPFGDVIKNDSKKVIQSSFDPKEIKKMRRYLPVGIN